MGYMYEYYFHLQEMIWKIKHEMAHPFYSLQIPIAWLQNDWIPSWEFARLNWCSDSSKEWENRGIEGDDISFLPVSLKSFSKTLHSKTTTTTDVVAHVRGSSLAYQVKVKRTLIQKGRERLVEKMLGCLPKQFKINPILQLEKEKFTSNKICAMRPAQKGKMAVKLITYLVKFHQKDYK